MSFSRGSRHGADFTVESLGGVHWNVTFTIPDVILSLDLSGRALPETAQTNLLAKALKGGGSVTLSLRPTRSSNSLEAGPVNQRIIGTGDLVSHVKSKVQAR